MFVHNSTIKQLRNDLCGFRSFLICAAMVPSLITAAPALGQSSKATEHYDHEEYGRAPVQLVEAVREATKHFINVYAATSAGYQPVLGCVSGPDHGAMGVHYLNGSLMNGEIDASKPQALIYEPLGEGRMRLVGVEFIVDSATWFKRQKEQGVQNPGPPALFGQLFQLVPSPNRYNLDTFFELHVWAWKDNPKGTFVDWNNQVTCDHQGKTI